MASLPEPPPNVPRIVDVQDPGTGHYVVMVRMPTQLAAKFPDKAWGTSIDAIGLSKQDSDKFPGYTLVDMEPLNGSPDLYWIFQKLDGPVWETTSKETPDLTPEKYKRLLVTTKTKQEVAPGTAPDAVGTILDEDTGEKITSSIVQDEENTGKSVKVTTTETLDTNADPIVGQQFDPGGAIIDITENVVPEGTQAEVGPNIAQSTVDAFGNGNAAKVTQKPRRRKTDGTTEEGWPKKQKKSKGVEDLTPQKYKGQTTTKITIEQVELAQSLVNEIPDPATPSGNVTKIEHEKVNDWRYEKRVTEEIIAENTAPLTGSGFAPDGTRYVQTEQIVNDGTAEERGANILQSDVSPIGNGKSIRQTRKATKKSGGSYVEGHPKKYRKSLGVENLTPAKFRGQVVRLETVEQKALANPDMLPDPVAMIGVNNVTEAATEKVNDERFQETTVTETVPVNTQPLVGGKSSQWGVLSTRESMVTDGTPVPFSEGVAEAVVDPFGNGKSLSQVVSYPSPDASGIISSLYDEDQDASNGIVTAIQRALLVNSKATAYAFSMRANGWFVERKGLDKFHSVFICSKINLATLPPEEIFWDHENVSLPDVLLGVSPAWGKEFGGDGGSGDSFAKASSSVSIDGTVNVAISAGFSGKTKAKVVRKFVYGPPSAAVTPYNIRGSTGTISIVNGSKNHSVSISQGIDKPNVAYGFSAGTGARFVKVGPVLTSGVTSVWQQPLSSGNWRASSKEFAVVSYCKTIANISCNIPASSPTGIASGSVVSRFQVSKQWRLGVWVVEQIEVYAP